MSFKASSIIISSELSKLSSIFTFLEKEIFRFIEDKEKVSILTLVIQEALVNAIIHGNKENKSKKVSLSYTFIYPNLHIKIEDEGEGIPNPIKKQNEIKDEDLLKESGRGIILMKRLCKNVVFGKNSIELIMEVQL